MNVSLYVLDLTPKGAQVVTQSSTNWPFWLPRSGHVEWAGPPRRGELVTAEIPGWLASKHKQLVALRESVSEPDTAKEPTMADQSNEGRGALFRETNKKSEKSPDMTGHLTLDGIKYRLAGWTREGKDGKKYLSIAASLPEEQRQQPAPANACAAATGREDRQQRSAGGKPFADEIPFAPERN